MRLILTILGLSGGFSALPAFAEAPLVAHSTKMGAYSDPENRERPGVLIELLAAMAKEIGREAKIAPLPWNRAVQTIGDDKLEAIIFPLIRSPARDSSYTWIVRVLNDRKVFFCLSQHPESPDIETLRKTRIGVIRGSPFETQLERLEYPQLDPSEDGATNARKLLKGRIDHWYVTYNTATHTFDSLGIPRSKFKVCHAVERTPIYMAANRSYPKETAAKLAAAFAKLQANGTVEALFAKYGVVDAGEGPGDTSAK